MSECILEIKHLKKYYGEKRGVEDVSLKLYKGDIYGFIGPNGAGKSTTLRSIMGLLNITEGDIYFKGKLLDPNDPNTKEKIGYIPSEIHLYDDMTVQELLTFHESFYDKDLTKRKNELTKALKVELDKKVKSLSLGNLKKVGIVLALMHEPELLIIDEPTSGLDPMMQIIFHNILLEEKKKGTTIIYSSHVLTEVSNISNKIGFIKDGVIIKEDSIENIKKDNYTYLTISSKEIDKIKKELKLEIKEEKDNEVIFKNNMETNELIKKLSKYNIDKLLIESISLEDLFENYYK